MHQRYAIDTITVYHYAPLGGKKRFRPRNSGWKKEVGEKNYIDNREKLRGKRYEERMALELHR